MTQTASLNRNLVDTSTPPIPEAYDWAERYDGSAGPLVNMAQAAPSTPPPAELLTRFGAAAADPAGARYGSIFGDKPLREAYAAELSSIYGGTIAFDDVGITAGCNMAFFVAALSVAKAGEAVLIPAPWYFNHQMALTMLGIEPKVLPVDAANGFVPEVEVAERLISSKVKAILLVTPNNPTGAVYPPETIRAFSELCKRRGLWLILDETYRDFLPEGRDRPHLEFSGSAADRGHIIQLYSFSKAFAMPGHRLGAILMPEALKPELGKALDTIQICPPRPGQAALTWAIGALNDWRAATRAEINRRGSAFRRALASTNSWHVESVGAYFAYVRHPFPGKPSRDVVAALVQKHGVLCLPGTYFGPGQDNHVRIAFANVDVPTIEALPGRLKGLRGVERWPNR